MADDGKGGVVVVSSGDELRKWLGAPSSGTDSDETTDSEPVQTRHEVEIDGQRISYTATAGTLEVRLEDRDKPGGRLFYVAYTRDDVQDPVSRPLTFCFNGGPGSSAVWLHMGCFGPRRVALDVDDRVRLPVQAVDNDLSILDVTDLVFIDPMSTGYSRPDDGEGEDYLGVTGDVESVAEFIRRFTTHHGRWGSPKFVAGESYGTTRAAALASHLQERHGMYLNGLLLLSVALQFQTLLFHEGNDLPYVLIVPTMAATAHYHGRVQADDLHRFLAEVEAWTYDRYVPALMRGNDLPEAERQVIAEQLAAYTGLTPAFVLQCNLKVSLGRFCRELLRHERRTVGRLDSRFTGHGTDAAGESLERDPSLGALMGAYGAAFHHDLKHRLSYEETEVYEFLNLKTNRKWNFGERLGYLDVTEGLRNAMLDNAHLQVFVASGLYDLATPFFATDYTLAHLGLEPERRSAVTVERYPAGHMMYTHPPSLEKLRDDVLGFIARACG